MNLQQLFAATRNTPGILYFTFPLFFQLALYSANYYSFMDESIDRLKTRLFASSQEDTFDFIVGKSEFKNLCELHESDLIA
jgi:hypothetical protein